MSEAFQRRELPPELASQPVRLQDLTDLADTMVPALQRAQDTIAMQRDRINELEDNFIDMADEILRGLEQDDDIEAEAASMQHLFQGSAGAVNAEISAQLADVKRTLMMPVLPVLDERGNFVGARRVDPDA